MSQTQTNTRLLSVNAALATQNKRKPINSSMKGRRIKGLEVRQNSTFFSAEDQRKSDIAKGKAPAKAYMDRYITNMKVTNQDVLAKPATKALITKALEAAGGDRDVANEETTAILREWLNITEMTVSEIANKGTRKFQKGQTATCKVNVVLNKVTGEEVVVLENPVFEEPDEVEEVKYELEDLLA